MNYLLDPFEFAKFRIKCSLLKRTQLERKFGSELLQADLFGVSKNVTMMPKKDEIALIVKRDAVTTLVLRIVRKERSKRTAHLKTQTSVEVVENYFRLMFCKTTSTLVLWF